MKNKIALIDCDSFFASCEQANNPELLGKPVCVLSQINDRGIVLARSKEVKKTGIKMCDPYFKIKNLYPEVVFVSSKMALYKETSEKVMEIVKSYSPEVEIASIDEAYINLTGLDMVYKKNYNEIAQTIRNEIFETLKIPVSIGISSTKLLAKLASEQAKNMGGVFEISQDEIIEKIGNFPISNVSGIGKQHNKQLRMSGIFTIEDFITKSDTELKSILGISAIQLKNELQGTVINKIENIPQAPKSIQSSSAFSDFSKDKYFINKALNYHIQQACRKLRSWNGVAGVIGIMLRYKNFDTEIKKERINPKTKSEKEVKEIISKLFNIMYNPEKIYRSCGVSLDDLSYDNDNQQNLFYNKEDEKNDKLNNAIDELENKFGKNIVKSGWL